MNELKNIWNELDHNLTASVDMNFKIQNSIIGNFQEEENLRKRYNPLVFLLLVIFAIVFIYIIRGQENSLSVSKYIGYALVVLSGVAIVHFSQRVKIPFKDLTLENSVIEFSRSCRAYLLKARLNLVIGILLQMLFLSIGLYLLILFENPNSNYGMIGAFSGIMLGLCGFAIGGSIAAFNKHYEGLFDITNQFDLEE